MKTVDDVYRIVGIDREARKETIDSIEREVTNDVRY